MNATYVQFFKNRLLKQLRRDFIFSRLRPTPWPSRLRNGDSGKGGSVTVVRSSSLFYLMHRVGYIVTSASANAGFSRANAVKSVVQLLVQKRIRKR